MEEKKRRELESRQREILLDLAKVLETVEGQRSLARILWDSGLGRAISNEEVYTLNKALRLFERIKTASPNAARRVLALVYALED